ncbi:MAG: hypothetical protein ACT4N2_05585 [Hyphomicrobium sp.]
MRRPGLDLAKVDAALKEAAWLSIHGTREDKDGIFRGPQLVLPDMDKIRQRLDRSSPVTEGETSDQPGLAEPTPKPFRPKE